MINKENIHINVVPELQLLHLLVDKGFLGAKIPCLSCVVSSF